MDGEPVKNNVVHGQEQLVLVVVETYEGRSDQGTGDEIERDQGLLSSELHCFRFTLPTWHSSKIDG